MYLILVTGLPASLMHDHGDALQINVTCIRLQFSEQNLAVLCSYALIGQKTLFGKQNEFFL